MRFVLLLLVAGLVLAAPPPVESQLLYVTGTYVVTELRPDKNKIGIGVGTAKTTRNWVEVQGRTRISRNGVNVSANRMWRELKRGTRIKIHGGRDFDQTIVAKKIWY